MAIPTLLTVKQFNIKHPAFPVGGLRHRIFYAEQNGLKHSGALVRNGRRVLINEERFFEWLTGGRSNEGLRWMPAPGATGSGRKGKAEL